MFCNMIQSKRGSAQSFCVVGRKVMNYNFILLRRKEGAVPTKSGLAGVS